MRTSNTDDSDIVVPKKVRRAIKLLADKNPALLEAPIAFLSLYSQEFETSKCMERSPALQYCLRQCFLSFQDVCRMIQKRTLKTITLRENIMNLIALGNSMGKSYPDTAEPFCAQLVKIIAMLEELDRQLAEASGTALINWSSIVSSLKATMNVQKKNVDSRPVTAFIPSLEDFAVIKTLGRGGFGAVYKAVFREVLEVAVKIVSQAKLRLDGKSESAYMDKMLASVVPNHPFICRLFCAFTASTKASPHDALVAVSVMEAIDGVDITELVTKIKILSFATVRSIMEQLLMAVEHMHFSGFVHRDIKLANILLTREGRVKVIDFDVNRLCIALAGSQHQISFFARTATEFAAGDKAGTEAYMAPEVHQLKEFGRASDWWSVGVVFFRLSFGRLPFRGQDLAQEIVNCDIEWEKVKMPPTGTPKSSNLKEVISQLLIKDPKQRLGSKEYIDIFESRLFSDANWRSLPGTINTTEDVEKLFAAKDCSQPVAKVPPPDQAQALALEDLVDYPGEHQKLLTFSSRLIRHLMSDSGYPRDIEEGREIKDDIINFRHCQQLTKIQEDTTCGTTTTDDRKKVREPIQVIIQEFNMTKMFRRIPPFEIQRLLCEDGMYRFTVTKIAAQIKFLSEPRLYYGDLLLDIDRVPLINLPLNRMKLLVFKKGSPLVVTVAQKNPFRDIGEGTFNLENYMYVNKPIVSRFQTNQKKGIRCLKSHHYHGFKLTLLKIILEGSTDFLCLVSSHALIWQKCSDDKNTYTGDIVLSVNQKRIDKLVKSNHASELLDRLLDAPSVELEFLPCSLLRTSNLPRL